TGDLLFLGRVDEQVKIRGVRIELGEIESVLATHPAVREAVVCDWQAAGDSKLAAYVVPRDWSPDDGPQAAAELADQLYSWLSESLPAVMVPSAIEIVQQFPHLPNGKINRRALPPPR